MKFTSALLILGAVSAIQLQQAPITNTCTNTNKATDVDEACSEPGNSAWNTITTSRSGDPKKATTAPYPGHTLH